MDTESHAAVSDINALVTPLEARITQNGRLGLPNELLMRIFKMSANGDIFLPLHEDNPAPLNLMFVCKLWYEIVRGMPELWSALIDIGRHWDWSSGTEESKSKYLQEVRRFLTLSRNHPVNISISVRAIAYHEMWENLLLQHAHRWRSLRLDVLESNGFTGRLFRKLNEVGENLEELTIWLPRKDDGLSTLDLSSKVRLRSLNASMRFPGKGGLLPKIITLPPNLERITCVQDLDFSRIITTQPSLRYVDVVYDQNRISCGDGIYTHSELRSIRLREAWVYKHSQDLQGDFFGGLLDNFCLPSITQIELNFSHEAKYPLSSLLSFLKRSSSHRNYGLFSSLHHLILLDCRRSTRNGWTHEEMSTFLDTLRFTPQLYSLFLDRIASGRLVKALTLDKTGESNGSSTENNLCPALEKLDIWYTPVMFCFSEVVKMVRSRLDRTGLAHPLRKLTVWVTYMKIHDPEAGRTYMTVQAELKAYLEQLYADPVIRKARDKKACELVTGLYVDQRCRMRA